MERLDALCSDKINDTTKHNLEMDMEVVIVIVELNLDVFEFMRVHTK